MALSIRIVKARILRATIFAAISTLYLMSAAGCGDALNKGKVGDSCATHTDCGSGLVCDCRTKTCMEVGTGNPSCGIPDAGPPSDAYVPDASLIDGGDDAGGNHDGEAMGDGATEDALFADGASEDGALEDGTLEDGETSVDATP